jgi:predicted RNA-binding Zn ribbon-like protein
MRDELQEIQKSSKFLWVGNWPAIDFVNTEIVADGQRVDLLTASPEVFLWLGESGLCEEKDLANRHPPSRLLDAARMYRSLARRGLEAIVNQRPVASDLLAKTSAYLRRNVRSSRLTAQGEGYKTIAHWHFAHAEDYLVPVAESLAKLVTEADLSRIRKCKNPDCILYFYDTSKGGQRSWCSLDICGNKLRVAASRRRRKGKGDGG